MVCPMKRLTKSREKPLTAGIALADQYATLNRQRGDSERRAQGPTFRCRWPYLRRAVTRFAAAPELLQASLVRKLLSNGGLLENGVAAETANEWTQTLVVEIASKGTTLSERSEPSRRETKTVGLRAAHIAFLRR